MLCSPKPHAPKTRMRLNFCLDNLWRTGENMGSKSPLLNTFHKAVGGRNRTVEKLSFYPQTFPLYPLAPGPNRAQTGLRKGLKTRDLGDRLTLSPQTFFDYNTKTNSYFSK